MTGIYIVVGIVCLALGAGIAYFIVSNSSNSKVKEADRRIEDARKAGRQVVVKKAALNTNPRTLMSGSGRGFVKVVADADSGRVLGAQILCDRASDMIDEFTVAIANGLTLADMGKVIRPHPTYVEALNELFE